MTVQVPFPKFRAFDSNGNPLSGGKLYTYEVGTSTPLPTYTDKGGLTPNDNPVILNANGEADVWVSPGVGYKWNLTDADDVQQSGWPVDDIVSPVSSTDLASISSAALGDALVGVKHVGAGAVARTQHDKNEETISVKDFGAIGDGVTDDTAAIQAAIDYATISGGIIRCPAGTYLCNITMKSNVRFIGDNRNTILSPFVTTSPVITLDPTGAMYFIIEGFEILGTDDILKTGQDGIYASPVGLGVSIDHFSINNVRIYQMGGLGINFISTSLSGPLVQLFTMTQVHVRDSHKSCFSFKGVTLDFKLNECNGQMANNDTAGIYPVCVIDGNGSTLAGASLDTCWFNHDGATALGNTATGVHLNDVANIGITNCSIENSDPFLYIGGTLTQHITVFNARCNTPYNQTNMIELNRCKYVKFINSRFLTSATATVGIKQTSGTMTWLRHIEIDELTEIIGATTAVDIKRNVTIAAGLLYHYRDMMDVAGEAAAADDLDTIYDSSGTASTVGINPDALIMLRGTNNSKLITVKHGTGNILLTNSLDVALGSDDYITLRWHEINGVWVESGRCIDDKVSETTGNLASITTIVNVKNKYIGKKVFNTNLGYPVYAAGVAAGDVWVDATGATVHTPV